MASTCVSVVKARRLRVVKLDVCGIPVTGASSAVVTTDGFVSVEADPQYEEGEEFQQKNANGEFCVNQKDDDQLKRVNLTVQLCTIDPDAIVVMTGERLLTTSVGATGTGVAYGEGLLTARFSLELWQPVAGAGACDASGAQQYMYWAWFNAGNAKVQTLTFENGVFNLSFLAETKAANLLWDDRLSVSTWIGTNNAIQSGEHYLHNVTTGAPPTAVCGATAI